MDDVTLEQFLRDHTSYFIHIDAHLNQPLVAAALRGRDMISLAYGFGEEIDKAIYNLRQEVRCSGVLKKFYG